MAHEPRTVTGTTSAGRLLTLNSRRLMSAMLKRVARSLGLPTSAAPDDLRQLIDDALLECGEDPKSVQIAHLDAPEGVALELSNSDGCFLAIPPEVDTEDGVDGGTECRMVWMEERNVGYCPHRH